MGELFPTVDKKTTIMKVKQFFDREDNYPLIRHRAWFDGIKSTHNDVTGVRGSNKGNYSETLMIDYAEYAQANRAVDIAIKGCSQTGKYPSQDIMKFRYQSQMTIPEVKECLNSKYGHTVYQRADDQACYEFAECLDGVTTVMKVNRKIIPKMLTFKNGKESGTKQEENGNRTGTTPL